MGGRQQQRPVEVPHGDRRHTGLQRQGKKKHWHAVFKEWVAELLRLRGTFKTSLRTGNVMKKSDIAKAESSVQNMRTDLKAWTKIKDLYA